MASFQTVVGTDGIAPYYNPTDKWAIWSTKDLYVGKEGNNKVIPKIEDYVIDPPTFTVYIVTAIDLSTYLTTMVQINITQPSSLIAMSDRLLSGNVTNIANTYRLYYDDSVTPATITVDNRLNIYGTRTTSAKFFLGTDVTSAGTVISVSYDNSGNVLSDGVALETLSQDNTTGYYLKTIPTVFTNRTLNNGDIVTVVLYNDVGGVVSMQELIVTVTSGYMQVNAPKKIITGITLDSPFMSNSLVDTLEYPNNLNISDLNLVGQISYSDGTTAFMPVVAGSNFKVFGIEQFNKLAIDQSTPLVLKYIFANNETAIQNVTYDNQAITNTISLLSVNPVTSYTFKLYCVPLYVNPVAGYKLGWYLMSMTRNAFYNVTNDITLSSGSNFNGTLYKAHQPLKATINTGAVSSSVVDLTLTQVVDVYLNSEAQTNVWPYLVCQDIVGNPSTSFGLGVFARSLDTSYKTIDVSMGLTDINAWLDMVYYKNQPLVNNAIEAISPVPTHFEIWYSPSFITDVSDWLDGMISNRYMIQQWNTPITLSTNLTQYSNIVIKFLNINGTTNSVLGISSMVIV